MHPVLFYIGSFAVRSYDVLVIVGIAAGLGLICWRAQRAGLSVVRVVVGGFGVVLIGILGARAAIVLVDLGYYIRNWQQIFSLYGSAFQGALIAGLLVAFAYARYLRISYWELGDLVVPGVALGQAIGRLGCFFNGCCYGLPTDSFLAMYLPTWTGEWAWRYPVQLMHAGLNLLIMGVLLWVDRRKPFRGFTFLVYAMLYSAHRVLLDPLRYGDPKPAFTLPAAPWIGVLEFLGFFSYDAGAGIIAFSVPHVGRWVGTGVVLLAAALLAGRWVRARRAAPQDGAAPPNGAAPPADSGED